MRGSCEEASEFIEELSETRATSSFIFYSYRMISNCDSPRAKAEMHCSGSLPVFAAMRCLQQPDEIDYLDRSISSDVKGA